MGLLRTLLIIVIVYYGFRLITRYVFPIVIKTFVSKAQQNMQNKMNDFHKQQQTKKKEGEVTIDYVPKQAQERSKKQGGEYVDFEEVE